MASMSIRRTYGRSLLAAAGVAASLLPVTAGRTNLATQSPEDGSGAFATGHYRNLFAEAGYSQSEIRSKINAAFQQLFHGNPVDQAIYYAAGTNANGPLAYITDIKHNDVRTEGLSYGMIIAAEMNRRPEFDALWNWSKTYLYHASPAHPSFGFFSWQARTNGETMSEFVAPDGESYYVMALYFAANRWGSGHGIYHYIQQATGLSRPATRRTKWQRTPCLAHRLRHESGAHSRSGQRVADRDWRVARPTHFEITL